MEEDWDSPTGYSPIDPTTSQNAAWKPPVSTALDNQMSRGRGFWKGSSDAQDWRRKDEPNVGWSRMQDDESKQNGFGDGDSRPRGRGVLRDREMPRRGRGGGGFGQGRQSQIWRDRDTGSQNTERSDHRPIVMSVDSNLVGKVIGMFYIQCSR